MNNSTPYELFCWSIFDDSMGAQRDGVDVQALTLITPEQKAEVGQRILEALAKTNDSRPFIAAGAMRLQNAASILKQRLSTGFKKNFDYLRVHAAHALYLIERWPNALAVIIEIFQSTPKTPNHQWTRMMAVEAMADFRDDKLAAGALFTAVEDEDDFIGFLAVKSLQKLYGQNGQVMTLLECLEETQKDPRRWKPQSLDQREKLFTKLQSVVGISMPNVARQKKENSIDNSETRGPNTEQMPLFGAGDGKR